MDIKFKQCHTSNYKKGRTQPIKYIVIHYTANNGDTAKNNADYYASQPLKEPASAHYFVDEYDTIWQSVKDTDTAWAVGGTSVYKHPECRNSNSISIELCSRNPNGKKPASDSGWYFKPETVDNAVELTKELMQKYNVPLDRVIRHYDVWDKTCPAPFVNNPKQWQEFKERLVDDGMTAQEKEKFNALVDAVENLTAKVDELTKANKVYHYWEELPDWAYPTIKALYDKGLYKGAGAGDLNLPEMLMRCLVIQERINNYGRK